MDFFEHEHRARRNTGWILLAFLVAVAAIVLSINVVGGYIYLIATERPLFPAGQALALVPRSAYAVTTVVVLGVILGGTLVRMHQLADGGASVADMVGARRIARDTGVLEEKRLLNVVEEMALASGIAVPQVYVMDGEDTINAFAAGYSPHSAAIVVTRGTLERLGRDEIQGVIGHEFSHILNGDMRLNIQLLGVIAGIVLVGAAGRVLMRSGGGSGSAYGYSREYRSSRRGDPRLFALGALLWLIGSVGVLAARLIKAAVAREREFLADASAVQFTRNPDGIGGALYKISQRGSAIVGRHAEELSHMCIGAPVGEVLEFPWLRTHPPIEERLERLLGPQAARLLKERSERAEAAEKGSPVVAAFADPPSAPAPTAAALVGSIGNPSAGHVDHARRLLDAIPEEVRAAAGSEPGAKAIVAALLLGAGDVRAAQLGMLREDGGEELAAQSARFADALAPLGGRARLPLLTLALPALKVPAQEARDRMLALAQKLIAADGKVSLGEFVIQTLLRRALGPLQRGAPAVTYGAISSVAGPAATILSLLAHAGGGGMAAFDRGMRELGLKGGVLLAPAELRSDVVDRALGELKLLAPLRKPAFIKGCVAVTMADDRLTPAEGELLRAVCAALDSPMPPILETSEAAA